MQMMSGVHLPLKIVTNKIRCYRNVVAAVQLVYVIDGQNKLSVAVRINQLDYS